MGSREAPPHFFVPCRKEAKKFSAFALLPEDILSENNDAMGREKSMQSSVLAVLFFCLRWTAIALSVRHYSS
jgi:hypothetical protein